MADYFRGGSYVCRGFSHEMSMKLERKAEENGAQIEFRQEVEKILVKNGRVTGVRTKRGDVINCDYVICGAYPNKVYTQMIEPLSEVPAGAIKMVNGRRLSVTTVHTAWTLSARERMSSATFRSFCASSSSNFALSICVSSFLSLTDGDLTNGISRDQDRNPALVSEKNPEQPFSDGDIPAGDDAAGLWLF